MKLTKEEQYQVEHWKRWIACGGQQLLFAPTALRPLLAIIDRLTKQ